MYETDPDLVFKNTQDFYELKDLAERKQRSSKKTKLVTKDGCNIVARHNVYDFYIIVEQFLLKQYFPKEVFDNYVPRTIVDIGAYINDFGLYCASKYGASVDAYEPVKQNFTIAIENANINNYDIRTFNEGVASTPVLDINVKDVQGEIHASSHRTYKKGYATKQIPCVTLDTVLDRIEKHVSILKIDTEGQEVDILNRDDFDTLANKIDYIVFETHSFIDTESMQNIYNQLNKGFDLAFEKYAVKWYRSKKI